MEDNKIIITNEEGKEFELNILFTFDANDKNYVICYEEGKEDDLFAFTYDDNNNLNEVEDEEELALINEVIEAFDGEENEESR